MTHEVSREASPGPVMASKAMAGARPWRALSGHVALAQRQIGSWQIGSWRADPAGPRVWLFEIAVLLGIITALAMVLQPRIMLLAASPHPFWLVVVAAALVHGTAAGLAAALASGLVAWLLSGHLGGTEDDFYDLMFRAFREPLLWIFAGLVLGAFRDRVEAERQALARQRESIAEDMARMRDHAETLRRRVAELEREMVLGKGRAPPFVSDWACLWMVTPLGWERHGTEGRDPPDPGRFLRRFEEDPRIYDSRYQADRDMLPEGAALAVPLRSHRPEPAGLVMLGGRPSDKAEPLENLIAEAHAVALRLGWNGDAQLRTTRREPAARGDSER